MRDEWTSNLVRNNDGVATYGPVEGPQVDSRSSRGLTRVGRQNELNRAAGLAMAHKAMRLKSRTNAGAQVDSRPREVSERRQVGDAESLVNNTGTNSQPWWRNVGMEEGL